MIRVNSFKNKYGNEGIRALRAFSNVDPLRCYYGDDVNPDEYLGYAERFVKTDKSLSLKERFLLSFHKSQPGHEFVDDLIAEYSS